MKLTVNLGDELNGCKITLPKTVPVTKNFDNTKIIGEANVYTEGDGVIAELNIINESEISKIKQTLECSVAGIVIKQTGNVIEELDLKCVSIQFKGKNTTV